MKTSYIEMTERSMWGLTKKASSNSTTSPPPKAQGNMGDESEDTCLTLHAWPAGSSTGVAEHLPQQRLAPSRKLERVSFRIIHSSDLPHMGPIAYLMSLTNLPYFINLPFWKECFNSEEVTIPPWFFLCLVYQLFLKCCEDV